MNCQFIATWQNRKKKYVKWFGFAFGRLQVNVVGMSGMSGSIVSNSWLHWRVGLFDVVLLY